MKEKVWTFVADGILTRQELSAVALTEDAVATLLHSGMSMVDEAPSQQKKKQQTAAAAAASSSPNNKLPARTDCQGKGAHFAEGVTYITKENSCVGVGPMMLSTLASLLLQQ